MKMQDVIMSIAKEIAGIHSRTFGGKPAFRKDCHGVTSTYFREQNPKDTDRIVIYGTQTFAIHSLAMSREGKILADLDNYGNNVEVLDPQKGTIKYTDNKWFENGMEPVFDMPFGEFKRKYMNKQTFSQFLKKVA